MIVKYFVKALLITAIVTNVTLGFCQDALSPQEKELLEQRFASHKLRSIKSDFVQEKYLAYLSSTVVSKGKFWFRDDNKLRWEYTQPFNFMVLMDNGKVTIKDEKNTSVYNKPNQTFDQLNKILIESVNGTLINNPQYNFSVAQNNKYYIINVLPNNKEATEIFKSIELHFFKENLAVFKVKMNEKGGDTVTVTFNNKQVNIPINDNVFLVK